MRTLFLLALVGCSTPRHDATALPGKPEARLSNGGSLRALPPNFSTWPPRVQLQLNGPPPATWVAGPGLQTEPTASWPALAAWMGTPDHLVTDPLDGGALLASIALEPLSLSVPITLEMQGQTDQVELTLDPAPWLQAVAKRVRSGEPLDGVPLQDGAEGTVAVYRSPLTHAPYATGGETFAQARYVIVVEDLGPSTLACPQGPVDLARLTLASYDRLTGELVSERILTASPPTECAPDWTPPDAAQLVIEALTTP